MLCSFQLVPARDLYDCVSRRMRILFLHLAFWLFMPLFLFSCTLLTYLALFENCWLKVKKKEENRIGSNWFGPLPYTSVYNTRGIVIVIFDSWISITSKFQLLYPGYYKWNCTVCSNNHQFQHGAASRIHQQKDKGINDQRKQGQNCRLRLNNECLFGLAEKTKEYIQGVFCNMKHLFLEQLCSKMSYRIENLRANFPKQGVS